MKRRFLILLSVLTVSILPACAKAQSSPTPAPMEDTLPPQEEAASMAINEPLESDAESSPEDSIEEPAKYSNDYISFTYNPHILHVTESDNMVIIGDTASNPSTTENAIIILNTVFSSPMDVSSLKASGFATVDSLFDSQFGIDDSTLSSAINLDDGYWEYHYESINGIACHGKIFSLEDDESCFMLSLISCSPSSALYSSLEECLNSIEYLGENPWIPEVSDRLQELSSQAEEASSASEILESGDIYDSIYELTDSFRLTYFPNSAYSVDLYLDADAAEAVSKEFISLCEKIYSESIPSGCSVTFLLFVNEKSIASLTITSGGSTMPLVFNDEYEAQIITEYNNSEFFSELDIDKQYDNALQDIFEKYQ